MFSSVQSNQYPFVCETYHKRPPASRTISSERFLDHLGNGLAFHVHVGFLE